jgi:hypothetical protein
MVNAGLRGEANTGPVIAFRPVPYYTTNSKDKEGP